MIKRNKARQQGTQDETAELRNRLEETEETLHAIRQYLVDAFVVNRESGTQVVTLNDVEFPYRVMVESMNEGAVTLIPDGTIFFCNPRFAEMVQWQADKLIGVQFHDLIPQEERSAFDAIFAQAGTDGGRGKFCLRRANERCVPVQLSLCQFGEDGVQGVIVIATDITERVQSEEKIRSLASKLTMAEQVERHRISQILHDDLQQRLFAIKAQLSVLKNAGGKDSDPSIVQTDINQIQDWLSEAILITRNMSIDLSPAILHGEGLNEAITWLSSQMKEKYGLEVSIESKESFPHLDDHMRVLLFQAVRELLFNIVKHADVLQAEVALERDKNSALITVSDGGKGFDQESVLHDGKTGHGLLLIQDRLGLLGCTLEINSALDKGTRAVIEFPVPGGLY